MYSSTLYHVVTLLKDVACSKSPVVGMPKGPMSTTGLLMNRQYSLSKEALWVIDKSIYGLEPGKMVV